MPFCWIKKFANVIWILLTVLLHLRHMLHASVRRMLLYIKYITRMQRRLKTISWYPVELFLSQKEEKTGTSRKICSIFWFVGWIMQTVMTERGSSVFERPCQNWIFNETCYGYIESFGRGLLRNTFIPEGKKPGYWGRHWKRSGQWRRRMNMENS